MKTNSQEQALDKISKESDEVAERLGLEVQNRIKTLESRADKVCGVMAGLGGLAATAIAYTCGAYKSLYGDPEAPLLLYVAPTIMGTGVCGVLGLAISEEIKKESYCRLKKEFPEKAEDIDRLLQLNFEMALIGFTPIG